MVNIIFDVIEWHESGKSPSTPCKWLFFDSLNLLNGSTVGERGDLLILPAINQNDYKVMPADPIMDGTGLTFPVNCRQKPHQRVGSTKSVADFEIPRNKTINSTLYLMIDKYP
ncbi:hypothetical protein RF11_13792 [Thelohanellus kitauei]|uniref:Uncharacterized protein n=1 Tax=Thelohanellus kitauei TaxID=669202 RepID=A0A0C2IV98_THEKT|nr:hypothetical protein RF11_13792 [Thelohanellus kitauei]